MSIRAKLLGLTVFFIAALIAAILAMLIVARMDTYQLEGELPLPGLEKPARVHRDQQGIPYIYAQSLDDLLLAQGFVTAQDRIFQMTLFKSMAQGRLSELIGEKGLSNDRLAHLLNFVALAERQARILSDEERRFVQCYVDGINHFIRHHGESHPLVFSLMGTSPEPWTPQDVLALQFFQIWSSSINWRQELLAQQLIDHLGTDKALELWPLSVNPDDESSSSTGAVNAQTDSARQLATIGLDFDDTLNSPFRLRHAMGSNSWASGARKSVNGAPILVNDPHIDARHLPGFWYPTGLISPTLRAVGGATPGVPGLGVGRTQHIAWGATNGYSDIVDLSIELLDPEQPGHYLEGEHSFAFTQRKATINIKDKNAASGFRQETLLIRETHRGPVISDHGMTVANDKVLSLRWSVPQYLRSEMGNRELLLAQSVTEARRAIGKTATPLNYIIVDQQGNIARQSSGFVPKRRYGDGLRPLQVTDTDNWDGLIVPEEMPASVNPPADWVGSANHRVVKADYPYAYSTHFSPSWRYRRLLQLFEQEQVSVEDHWRFLMDNKNPMAERVTPLMVIALRSDPALGELANILDQWNTMDTKDQAAPLIFQRIFSQFAHDVFADELGEELTTSLLRDTYFWQERLVRMILSNQSEWFDNISTAATESRDSLFRSAATQVKDRLGAKYGPQANTWRWGDGNKLTFFHSVFPGADAAKWLGGGIHAADGSTETLNRAVTVYGAEEEVKVIPSLRMVIDLGDPNKIEAHIPGGTSERLFSEFTKNQLPLWLSGKPGHWWFSDEAIGANTRFTLSLVP